ncbi:MAG: MFS transporter [Actinobacteria bacterium]|nr:MAG: MFS transporter [Actinomycetota bacterium]
MSTRQRSARSRIRRLAVGRLISITGGAAAYTALNFTVWDRTHSPSMQALSLLLTFGVAGLLGSVAGALGDRFDRRKVMIWSEAISAGFFLAMVFVHAPATLIVLAFGSAIAELPFLSASRAAIPNLVESDEQISWANGLITMGVHAGIAVGPLLGGLLLLLPFHASGVFALNAVTFGVSVVLTLTVHGDFQEDRATEPAASTDHDAGILAGLAFLWRESVLRRLAIAWFVFVLGMGMSMVADAPLAESFRSGSIGFALLITCWGTGSVLGAACGRFMKGRTEPVWLAIASFGIAAAAFGVGWAPVFPVALVCLLIMGTSDGITMVAENGIMQRRTPDALRSRTMAAFDAVLSCGLAIAYILAARVLRTFGPQPVYRIGGVTALLAALMLSPLIRLRHEPEVEAEVDAGAGRAAPPRFTSVGSIDGEPVGVLSATSDRPSV